MDKIIIDYALSKIEFNHLKQCYIAKYIPNHDWDIFLGAKAPLGIACGVGMSTIYSEEFKACRKCVKSFNCVK